LANLVIFEAGRDLRDKQIAVFELGVALRHFAVGAHVFAHDLCCFRAESGHPNE
jgi:hypothetical protein